MRIRYPQVLSAGLALVMFLLSASPVWAQQHVVDRAALQQAVADRLAADRDDRGAVTAALAHPEARRIAARLGLDLKRAEHAVAALDGRELAELAVTARAIQADRAGEAHTVTLSITTLLLVLIIILLVAK